jgi:ATP phosphoribosyltransferase regulatory subunit
MDLRQLAALAPEPPARRRILAPSADDAALDVAIAQLRDAGEVVVVDFPGHEDAASELACDRKLEKKEGKWRVT